MAIQDTDIFVVQRGEQAYKMPATQLNDYVEVDGGLANPDDLTSYKDITLQYVCAQGSDPATCNRNMRINGSLSTSNTITSSSTITGSGVNAASGSNMNIFNGTFNLSHKGVQTGIGDFGVSSQGHIGCNGTLSGENLGVTDHVTCKRISAAGNFKVQAGNGTDGRVLAPSSIGLTSGVRSQVYMTISSGGARGLIQCDNLRRAEDIVGDVDTSNFINALKRITLSNYGTNTPIAINPAVLQADEQARFLTYDETYPKEELIPAFLIGVCQRQQELIENLSTRVAQLEAEHAQVMSNMQNNGGY